MIPRSSSAAPFDDGLGNCLRLMNPSVKTSMLYNATTYAAMSSCEISNPKNSVTITRCHHCTYVRETWFCSATPPARQSQAYSQHASHQQLANRSVDPTLTDVIAKPPSRRRKPRFLETSRLADQSHQMRRRTRGSNQLTARSIVATPVFIESSTHPSHHNSIRRHLHRLHVPLLHTSTVQNQDASTNQVVERQMISRSIPLPSA
jgi:hypothetical protein